MLADGNGTFTKMAGMSIDMTSMGMGIRSQRYALIAKNGLIKYIGIDKGKEEVNLSSAENILRQLQSSL